MLPLRPSCLLAAGLFASACVGGDGIDPENGGGGGGRGGKADEATSGEPFMEVIFSPQAPERSHNARVASILRGMIERIDAEEGGDGAGHSVDVAMYSFSDAGIKAALAELVSRGVAVRMIFEPARKDKGSPAGTKSAGYEDVGIDVRYINKIMHHKFAILDGPRDDESRARTAVLITGSGNWSSGAATRYDENTLFQRGDAELVLRMQREFNLLWQGSKDFVWGETDANLQSMPITDEMIEAVEDPDLDVGFTSDNFQLRVTSSGPSFRIIPGRDTVADLLVGLIDGAERSIHVASGHLRSRAVSDALVRWREAHPDGDLRVYLDGQEYLSSWYHQDQLDEVDQCLEAAGTSESSVQRCWDKGFLFSYQVHEAGVPLRYKFYAYRWDTSYADQMHNKFFLFDGEVVASGSYNLSDNAEHDTMENMVVHRNPALAEMFERKFEELWTTGEEEDRLGTLTAGVQGGSDDIPLVFPPMALTWDQVTELKEVILNACPAVDSDEYRRNAASHRACPRD
ncbi:MAG: DUF1669 domain-containing protein [Deltaproteobacteria bacterium]|nr:DUF1669 domain-containing protein [Deltaproteobacteria bacterium]